MVRRSAYLVLLLENPPALGELVTLCGASPWIAEQMSRHPVLLDEFLDRAKGVPSALERFSFERMSARMRDLLERLSGDRRLAA